VPYLSASAVVIHYEEALYQVYVPLPLPLHYLQTDQSVKVTPIGKTRLTGVFPGGPG